MEQYSCSINLTGENRDAIPAGTPFYKDELVEHTFTSLEAKGYITQIQAGVSIPAAVTNGRDSRTLTVGLPNQTPAAAIYPPMAPAKVRRAPESLTAEQIEECVEIRVKIKELTGKMPGSNCRLDTLKQKLAEAQPKEVKEEKPVAAAIWTWDPKALEEVQMPQLLDAYIDRCAEFKKEPENFVNRQLLIDHMCSEFISK